MGEVPDDDAPTGYTPTELGAAIDDTEAHTAWALDDEPDLEFPRRLTPGRITAMAVGASVVVIAVAVAVALQHIRHQPEPPPPAPAPSSAPTAGAQASTIPSRYAIAGMIVFLDPGHNGSNDASISRQVPNGRGGTRDCQTSGTATADGGLAEHTFTWDVTLRVRQALTALGVRTAMSRGDDTGLGPCVDERAAMANSIRPDAVVSIHGDDGPATGRGFHILYAAPPLNTPQAGPSVKFAKMMRAQLAGAGIPPATYVGTSGFNPRADIAELNLAQYPSILVELGNMKNPADAALMTTEAGRQKYADAVVRGIVEFLSSQRSQPEPEQGESSPNPAPTKVPRTTTAPAAVAANPYSGMDDEHVQWFRSPSGNIHCQMSFQRAAPAAYVAAYGEDFLPDSVYCMSGKPLQSVSIRSDGSLKRVCTDDVSCGGNAPLDEGVLPYGQSAVLGPFTCLSEESGMTCTANGRGFKISTAGIVPVY